MRVRSWLSLVVLVGFALAAACSKGGVETKYQSTNPAEKFSCDTPVPTVSGLVQGGLDKEGKTCVWKGLPYAAPPVGELRWRPPQDPLPHTGIYKARAFGPQCRQPSMGSEIIVRLGEGLSLECEDCLYLNIWAPPKSGRFPVMVWIHGGDLLQGAGSRQMYWGDRLAAEKDVIVVTINYRLGPLGFLYHSALADEDPNHSAGNYGLLDQVKALEWVRANIAGFGGDPDNVAIFGQSAGGWSVCNLLSSPAAAGLFDRAIIQSGGCQCFRTVEQGESYGEEFAARLGCTGTDAALCLRAKTGDEIIAAMGDDWQQMLAKFFPHVDGYALEQSPIEALRSGRFNNVPILVGSTRDEFKIFFYEIPGGRTLTEPEIYPAANQYMWTELTPGLLDLYPVSSPSYRVPADALLDGIGDAYLSCPCYRAAEAAALYQPGTFYYRFDYDENSLKALIGASHGNEVSLLFDGNDRIPASLLYPGHFAQDAQPLVDTMMAYWVNFARTGDPNGPGLPPWPEYTTSDKERLILDKPVGIQQAPLKEKCEYWDRQGIVIH